MQAPHSQVARKEIGPKILAAVDGVVMLHKCANPSCFIPFRRLREGKLFQVETEYFRGRRRDRRALRTLRPSRHVEHYWLCDHCSREITLAFDLERGVIAVPLAGEEERKPSLAAAVAERQQIDLPGS